jgi:CRP-like cAMP-binding protein
LPQTRIDTARPVDAGGPGNTREQIAISDLRYADLFVGLSDDDLEQIATSCTWRIFRAGEYCALQGTTTGEIGIISSGKVAIETRIEVPPYAQTLQICILTKGNMVGWSALVPPNILTASVRCMEKSEIIYIKAADLRYIFKESPSIELIVMKNLAAVLSSRLRDSWSQLTGLVSEMVKQGR